MSAQKTRHFSNSNNSNNSTQPGRYDQGVGRYNNGRGRGFSNRGRGGYKSGNEDLVMSVDSGSVGKIIGKGGSMIRELESDSGAFIKIGETEGSNTKISLRGSNECQNKAKNLINDLLNSGKRGNDRRSEDGFNRRGGQSYVEQPVTYHSDATNEPADSSHKPTTSTFNLEDYEPPVIDWDYVNRVHDEAQKQKWAKCPPIEKNFYEELPEVANMSEREVEEIRLERNKISVTCGLEGEEKSKEPAPNPITTFEQAFHQFPDILKEIYKQNFKTPSPIQSQSWPVLLKGRDLIGIAQTGTGKTLAFLLPALIHIDNQPVPRSKRGGPNVLILAPTRELALQIEKEVNKYNYKDIKCVCIYGGGSKDDQIAALRRQVEIIIATPGRLNDLIQGDYLDTKSVTYLVLDEADRMLDMGFGPQINLSLLNVRPDRQTVMTSATWPAGVRRLALKYLKDPVQVVVGSLDLAAVHSVTQHIEMVNSEEEKEARVRDFIYNMAPDDKVIIFMSRKARVSDFVSDFHLEQIKCDSIHGGKEQCDREMALEDFRTGEIKILLATDLASRGLDIDDVTHIINYDFPKNMEEYVHRVGRTGRMDKTGVAITYFTRNDWGNAGELIKILSEANQEIPDELYNMADRFEDMKKRRSEERDGRRGRGGFRGRSNY